MIKKIHFYPAYSVEFENGDTLPFPKGFDNKETKAGIVGKNLYLANPNHPPQALKKRGWEEIHPSLTTTQKYFFFSRDKGYEVYGDMNGPFKTIAWFALGNNPNNPNDTRWARK